MIWWHQAQGDPGLCKYREHTCLYALDCGCDRIMASGPCFDFPAPRAVGKNLRAFDHVTERKPGQNAYQQFTLSTETLFFFNLLIYLNKTTNRFKKKKQFINYRNSFKYNLEISFLSQIPLLKKVKPGGGSTRL